MNVTIPTPTEFALDILGCKETIAYTGFRDGNILSMCGTHTWRPWPCPVAETLAQLVACRDELIRTTLTEETQP